MNLIFKTSLTVLLLATALAEINTVRQNVFDAKPQSQFYSGH